mgnify:CR=1 FL=1
MAGLTVLPELLALGSFFRLGSHLMAYLVPQEGNPDAMTIQLSVRPGGDYDFLLDWQQNDPQAFEAWGFQLVLSLNRMAAEQMDRVEVWMPGGEPFVPARR